MARLQWCLLWSFLLLFWPRRTTLPCNWVRAIVLGGGHQANLAGLRGTHGGWFPGNYRFHYDSIIEIILSYKSVISGTVKLPFNLFLSLPSLLLHAAGCWAGFLESIFSGVLLGSGSGFIRCTSALQREQSRSLSVMLIVHLRSFLWLSWFLANLHLHQKIRSALGLCNMQPN